MATRSSTPKSKNIRETEKSASKTDSATYAASKLAESIAQTTLPVLPISLMTPRDVMVMLRISRSGLHDMVKDGRLPSPIRFGPRMPRWNRNHIEAHLAAMANNTRGVLS